MEETIKSTKKCPECHTHLLDDSEECDSCKAMLNANHPDFIEIDAASHTGVENVRQILEACSYLIAIPLLVHFGEKIE